MNPEHEFPNHTDTNQGEQWKNASVVYWGTGYGTSLDKGPNFETIIQSLVNETAR